MISSDELLLAYDLETGGLDEEQHSVLTGCWVVLDSKLNKLDSLSLRIKPDDGNPYRVTAGALSVNKINLVSHDKLAISESNAGEALYDFLKKNLGDRKGKFISVGHNIPFDEAFLTSSILSKSLWLKFVSHHKLDTVSIAKFLILKGKLPKDTSLKLENLAKTLGIEVKESNLHDSTYDTNLTIEVLKRLLEL